MRSPVIAGQGFFNLAWCIRSIRAASARDPDIRTHDHAANDPAYSWMNVCHQRTFNSGNFPSTFQKRQTPEAGTGFSPGSRMISQTSRPEARFVNQ